MARRQTYLDPNRPFRNSFKRLRMQAHRCGLYLARYNPGDGATFKVLTKDVDYFAASSSETLLRTKKIKQVEAFVEGFCQSHYARKSKKRRKG